MYKTLFTGTLLVWMAISGLAGAVGKIQRSIDLTELSLEELMDVEVFSVSRKGQKLFEAAAAVYVISGEDIRRSGATSIPEALRLAPGLHVGRLDASKWAVTSRGFNGRFANKLLVLIDGRSVYTPLFSGVFWEAQEMLLEDVERIEVVRGPGATLWGANAVNGVIDIITRNTADTQGGLVTLGAGTEERGFGALRYGGRLGTNATYRVTLRYFDRDRAVDASGADASDAWRGLHGGFRTDWDLSERDALSLQGNFHTMDADQTLIFHSAVPPFRHFSEGRSEFSGENIGGHWRRTLSASSDLALQAYYDHTVRKEGPFQDGNSGREIRHTFGVDAQHRFCPGERQEIVWGLGYRSTRDDIRGIAELALNPPHRGTHLFSAFLQDDIALIKDRWRLILGTKLEHNAYSGFEFQPSARLLILPRERHTVWMAVSRAIREPSRAESDFRTTGLVLLPNTPENPGPLPVRLDLRGSRDFDSERLLAWELGYRTGLTERVSLDFTGFYNAYDRLRTAELGALAVDTTASPAQLVLPLTLANKMVGTTRGAEFTFDWQPSSRGRLRATYTCFDMDLKLKQGSTDLISETAEGESPRHQFSVRPSVDLNGGLELDMNVRYVDGISGLNAGSTLSSRFAIGSYVSMDARLGWNLHGNLRFSLVGRNLLDSHHTEFNTPAIINTLPTDVERGMYGSVTYEF